MTITELKAEVLTLLRKYDDLGLVDPITLEINILNRLKRFGANVMENHAIVLEVNGGYAELPKGFFRMNSAVKCHPYTVEPEYETDDKWRNDYAVSKRIVNNYEWDNMSNSHYKKSYTEVIEKKLIRGSKIHFKHRPVQELHFSGKIPKEYVTNSCINRLIKKSPNSSGISLTNTRILTEFSEGFILLQYESLPEEDGEIIIPDIPELQEYLKNFSAYKILEGIWVNDETETVERKMAYFKSESLRLEANATTAVKFSKLSPNWHKKLAEKNRLDFRKNYIR